MSIEIGDKVKIVSISKEDAYYESGDHIHLKGMTGTVIRDCGHEEYGNGWYSASILLDQNFHDQQPFFYKVRLKKIQ